MKPQLVDRDQIILVGFSFFGDPFKFSGGWTEENEIGRLWVRFMAYWEQHGSEVRHLVDPDVMYEVHVEHPETAQTGGEPEIEVRRVHQNGEVRPTFPRRFHQPPHDPPDPG